MPIAMTPEQQALQASFLAPTGRAEWGWRLTGQKVWTSLAHQADRAIAERLLGLPR